jgi:hypothetical protein
MYIGFPIIGLALVFVLLYFVVTSRRDTSPTRREAASGSALFSGAARPRPRGIDPDLIAELVALLRGPGVDLEPTALELAEHGERAHVILNRARAGLVGRLQNRSDDFAATRALQAVNAASARLVSRADRSEQDRLVHAGLSGVERLRIWLRTRTRRLHRQPDAAIRTTPRPDTLSSPAGERMRHTGAAFAPGHSRLELKDRHGQASPRLRRIGPAAGHPARSLSRALEQ